MASLGTSVLDARQRESTVGQSADAAVSRSHPSRMRVAVVVNQIPPYYVRLFQELSDTPGWNLKVFTFVDREVDRQWEVREPYTFATHRCYSLSYVRRIRHRGDQTFDDARQIHLPVGLVWDLVRFRPDVVLTGELGGRTVISSLYARLFRKRVMACFEGTRHTERDISRKQRWVRRLVHRLVDSYIVNGQMGKEYLEDLGVPSNRIFETGQVVDTQTFAQRLTDDERAALRGELGIRGHCYLFCGSLNQRKGSDKLIEAWAEFSRGISGDSTLVLVGEGAERTGLEQRIAELGLNNVRLLGHVDRDKLPAVYRAADVFVLPTLEDCWALVVNEAMASGLPVINSIYAGSSEVIVEGENGWVMDPLNRESLVSKLRAAWEARDRQCALGHAAEDTMAHYSVPAVAERMRRVAEALYKKRRP